MAVETLGWHRGKLRIIDQTQLPSILRYVYLDNDQQVWEAIKKLKVRGAPAIGIAAAFGVFLGVRSLEARNTGDFIKKVHNVCDYLATSRPTAVNLFWALDRQKNVAQQMPHASISEIKSALLNEARLMVEEDNAICKAIGDAGQELLSDGQTILTHCNAGGLATASYGTALAVVYRAIECGKKISVYADETRPLLQGGRLTAWELLNSGVDVTVICDNMAATVLASGKIDAVIVGADRMAANGDFANKIGTYGLAILAKEHGVPFYTALPTSTIDMSLEDGTQIPIEERDGREIGMIGARRIAPKNCKFFNPAFDVTPNRFLSGIITEKGVITKPFAPGLKKLFKL